MIIGWIFVGVILFVGSIYDVKSYSLPTWLVLSGLCGSLTGMVFFLMTGEKQLWELLLGGVPGGSTLILAFLTKEQIGYGDGLLLLMLGGCLGGEVTLGIWLVGLVVSFVVSVVLLVLRKANKNTRIPFVPCLFLGYVLTGIGGWMGVW